MVSLNRHHFNSFLLLTLSLSTVGAPVANEQFVKPMTVATKIDKNSFYNPEINVYFEDEVLYPQPGGRSFQNVSTHLVVEAVNFSDTTPFSLNHVIYLTKNVTTCYEIDDSNARVEILESDSVYPDYKSTFVKTYVNDIVPANELTETNPLGPLSFNEVDATGQVRYTRYPFTLVFKDTLPKPNTTECSGTIQVMAEFAG